MDAFVPCDKCSMRSYVHVELDTGLPLSFWAYAVRVVDLRHLLHQEVTA